ncbi:MAG TPA: hypothetical protein VH475_19705 [Tepidisphaeraceae bacterium]
MTLPPEPEPQAQPPPAPPPESRPAAAAAAAAADTTPAHAQPASEPERLTFSESQLDWFENQRRGWLRRTSLDLTLIGLCVLATVILVAGLGWIFGWWRR